LERRVTGSKNMGREKTSADYPQERKGRAAIQGIRWEKKKPGDWGGEN